MKKKRFWTEKKRKSVVWMCKMRKGSENKKKERKKNETIETAAIRFGNVILYTHPKTVSMYEKMGFRRQKTGMAIYNGNAESLKWMEDIGFLLEEGYRFGDNDYERQPYVSPRSIRQEQEKQNQTA